MTEAEWLKCTAVVDLLTLLEQRRRLSPRKLRLFAVECCRRNTRLMADEACRAAVDVAELLADGLVPEQEVRKAHFPETDELSKAALATLHGDADSYPHSVAFFVSNFAALTVQGRSYNAELRQHCHLLRDIFGPPPWRTEWTPPVQAGAPWFEVARVIYDSREYDALPALADALEEDGCTSERLLSHLRGPGPHVRGCWALDVALGFR